MPPTTAEAAAPAEARPSLHSKPGSQRTIYLDFDGQDVKRHASGTNSHGVAPAPTRPGSRRGRSAFQAPSSGRPVQSVWQRVAEDYAPFDVDVTTEFPGQAAITRSDSGDAFYGTRALISPAHRALSQICGGGCGGIAFFDVFDEPAAHASVQPWIFRPGLGNDTKAIAEAVSHEVGHNLGLDHDGRARWATTRGTRPGPPSWASATTDPSPSGAGATRRTTTGTTSRSSRATAPPARRRGRSGIGGAGPALPAGSAYITSGGVDVYEPRALRRDHGGLARPARPAPTSTSAQPARRHREHAVDRQPASTRVDWDVDAGCRPR